MTVQGPYRGTLFWIGLDADPRPTVRKGTKYFVKDTGYWEIYTGAGWKVLPAKHQPPTNDFSSDSNCVAVYNMDTDSAGLIVDSGPIGTNTLTNVGVTSDSVTYKQGDRSGSFGSGDRLAIADSSTNSTFPFKIGETNSQISVCYWVNFNYLTALTTEVGAISKWSGTTVRCFTIGSGGADHKYTMWMGYNGGLSWEFSDSFGTAVTTGVWYHVSCSLNGTTGDYRIRIWDDTAGALLDSDTTGTFTNAPMAYGGNWEIGRHYVSYMYGNIDEVVIWNTIKTPTDFDNVRKGEYTG